MLCRDKVFPKRSRWILGTEIRSVALRLLTEVISGNETPVKTRQEFLDRHQHFTKAVGLLGALDANVELARDVLEINADKFDHWAGLWNAADRAVKAQLNSDTKRYETIYGALSLEDKIRDLVILDAPLRSPNPSNNNERNVTTDGALNNNNPNNSNGVVADHEDKD